ncbi:deoxyribodipyrimidine photo-lyase [Thermodesulfovibrio hydrogeniphilus]
MIREQIDTRRILFLKEAEIKPSNVVYWMSRDQRVDYNHALLYAQKFALEWKSKLFVVFNLVPNFLGATLRQYDFMLKGLKEVEGRLSELNIPLILLIGEPTENIPKFVRENDIKLLLTDFDPLRIKRKWKEKIASSIETPFLEVDTHNIVPAFYVSDKKEAGAYTLRPKIKRLLPSFLRKPEEIVYHPYNDLKTKSFDIDEALNSLKIDRNVQPVDKFLPGTSEAKKTLEVFLNEKLHFYNVYRNDPNIDCQSNLSPYLHFGHISSLEVALKVIESDAPETAKEAFLEELIVRKELSDNFCFYEPNYDNINGAPQWARESLEKHKSDKREYVYTLEHFENAETHDPLWNAAQLQMVREGKMHGYLRMYWAKKILEWTISAEEAIQIAIYLNDKYEIDGRDPNGYTGVLWSIGAVHDRPWKERPIFGKVRYMSFEGCKRKFDVEKLVFGQILRDRDRRV